MNNRNTDGLTGVQQVTKMALRSHTSTDQEQLANIARAVCASPAMKKSAGRGDRNTRTAATPKHVTGRRGDQDRPAIACHLILVAPFSFGLTIDGRATRRRFDKALPRALRTLFEDCGRARQLLAERPDEKADHRPNAGLMGDDENFYCGRINLPPTMTDEALVELMPEIEAKARELFDEASRRTRHARANKEVCHA
ncbi:hypothetical protein PQR64_26630 [Paraburkholderia phytofirmans]|uniref:hypothetical protein n=1 Tax=Paraburkholderia phytofirmans TaxID=261302 RepID=UPI0038BADE0B